MADEAQQWKSFTTSAGVELEYGPFPGGLYWDIMARALEEFPDPTPPTREIEVVDGKETVPDLENPEYKAAMLKARAGRMGILGEAALEMCVRVKGDWEPIVQRLAKKWVKEPPPDGPEDRRVWFLSKYALRTVEDWKIVNRIQRFSQIEDDEVRQRAEFFPGDVAGAEGAGADAPGPPAG